MDAQLICTACGYAGEVKMRNKGNVLIELILWFFFIIPGIIYSIWRRSDKKNICPQCGNITMIPINTPMGQKLWNEQKNNPLMSVKPQQKTKNKRAWTLFSILVVLFVFILFIVANTKPNDVKNTTEQSSQVVNQAEVQSKQVEKVAVAETNPVKKIGILVSGVTGKSEVTVWDSKGNIAKEESKPPYEVIVNAGNGDIASCYYAKNVAFEIMKKLYTDETVKDKISRIIFTSWGHLRVSVGSEDGVKTDWNASGPTNFWKVMMQYKSYEDETGSLNQRTWGKSIATDCN